MNSMEIMRGVEKIIDQMVALKPGESILVIRDWNTLDVLVEAFSLAAAARGADVFTWDMEPRRPGESTPPALQAAMNNANVIFHLATAGVGGGLGQARSEACAKGARYLLMNGAAHYYPMLLKGGMIEADFVGLRKVANSLTDKFTKAKKVKFMTKAGTNLTADITGREGRELAHASEPGTLVAPPSLETGVAPLEGTAQGEVVIDGFCLGEVVKQPFKITFKDGLAVKIEGEGGRKLRETCESFRDPNMYNIAEMAIGLNPYGKMSASGIESESKLGSAHIALGNSLGYGGTVKAPMHIDLVFLDCTVYLDNELIMENGVPRSFSIPK